MIHSPDKGARAGRSYVPIKLLVPFQGVAVCFDPIPRALPWTPVRQPDRCKIMRGVLAERKKAAYPAGQ